MTWSSATPMAGAGSTGGHYVELTDFFKEAQGRRNDGASHRRRATRSIRARAAVLAVPLEATPRACPIARTGLRPE